MAVDAALLAELAELTRARRQCASTPGIGAAVSIGRLQQEAPVRVLSWFADCPSADRRPGCSSWRGHDNLCCRALEQLPEDSRSVLGSHQLIMDAVLGHSAVWVWKPAIGGCAIGNQSGVINCFELSAACDLIDGHTGKKLVGSAQRREGRALLQQMSLPQIDLATRDMFLECLKRVEICSRTFSGHDLLTHRFAV